ncbi:hypothetical protein [Undibacterium sp. TJN19]|uniref:hypothetical protein n=1 Tax=Undibacterium sp. TJN19 TaxID=3413055 RepID=UPI003BF1EB18
MKKLITLFAIVAVMGCEKKGPVVEQAPIVPVKQAEVKPAEVKKVPQKIYEGPFGLAMGISTDELTRDIGFVKDADTSYFFTGKAPKPIPGVENYIAIALPNLGLCKIVASATYETVNDTGAQLKQGADKFKEMMETKYGAPSKKVDFANQDVYRRNPQFWMMASKEDSASYGYLWLEKKDNLKLPNNIVSIGIFAQATSMKAGFVKISYEFSNFTECQKEMKKAKAANL